MPAVYAFPKRAVDVARATEGLLDAATLLERDVGAVILAYDMAYAHAAEDVYAALAAAWPHDTPLVLSRVCLLYTSPSPRDS